MRTRENARGIRTCVPRHPGASPRQLAAAAAVSVLLLGGCTAEEQGKQASPTATQAATESSTSSSLLRVEQPWMKSADSGATAVFGTLTNDGEASVTLTGATAEGISKSVELHETVMDNSTGSTVMQKMANPLVLDPGESVELQPGGEHIMLMDLTCAPMAGQNLSIVLTFSDGATQTVQIPVRDYQGAQEEYAHQPSATESAHPGGHTGHGEHESLPMCQESQ